jgi:competence protein ComEC
VFARGSVTEGAKEGGGGPDWPWWRGIGHSVPLWRALVDSLEAEQDRWFLWVPVLVGLGIVLYFSLSTEPNLLVALAPVPASLALALVWRRGVPAVVGTSAALALAFGFAAAKVRTEWVRAPVLERQVGPVEAAGFVELVEPRATRGQRITLRVTKLGVLDEEMRPRRARIRTTRPVPGLKPGDAIRLKATLAPPAIPALPGDYDFARAAWFAGLGAIGYATTRPTIASEAGEPPRMLRISASIERVRQSIGARILAALSGEPGAIANALITGERGGISQATNGAFRDSGLFHILSISGLHMVVMAGAVFFSVRLALAAVPALALRFRIKKWAAGAAALAALGYLLISGSSTATVRSWIMISIMFLAVMLDRPAVALRNVAIAALAILFVLPESVFDVGFQMSFAAVVALVAVYEEIRERFQRHDENLFYGPVRRLLLFFGGIVLSTLVASVAVAPLAAFHFHKSQQYAILANLIAIPICNLVVMPAALATLVLMPFGLEAWPLWLMGKGIEAMVWCAYVVAGLPGAVARLPAIPNAALGLMVVGGLWLCLWRTRWRLLGIAGLAAGLGVAPGLPRADMLVGRDGQLVAIRNTDGRWSALTGPGATFELQRWLEHDGDGRTTRAATAGEGYRCDALGCTALVKEQLTAVARHPAALADDCARARILVMRFPRPRGCQPSGTVLDFFAVRSKGTHAIYISGSEVRMITVADMRGLRPWSLGPTRRASARRPFSRFGRRDVGAFAAPREMIGGTRRPRPEIEDEDGPQILEEDGQ